MTEKSEWLTHGDDLLVDSLHDVLEGPVSINPVAMEPTKRPAARSGIGGIVTAGVILGVVIGVGARMLHVAPAAPATPAPAIAARLSAPVLAQLATSANRIDETAGAVELDEEDASAADDEDTAVERERRTTTRARSTSYQQAGVPQDIYAPYGVREELLLRRAHRIEALKSKR